MLSSSEAEHVLGLLQTSKPVSFTVHGVDLETSYSDSVRVRYDEIKVESKDITDPDELNTYAEAAGNVKNYIKQDFNGWEYIEDSPVLHKWVTGDGHAVTLDENRKGNLIFSIPLPFDSEDSRIRSWNAAKFKSNLFLLRNDPKDIDYQVCRDETAYEVFREIPGVGDETAVDLIQRDVYSYNDLLDNYRVISRQYRTEAKEEIQERIDNGERVLRDERLLEEFSDYMAAHKI